MLELGCSITRFDRFFLDPVAEVCNIGVQAHNAGGLKRGDDRSFEISKFKCYRHATSSCFYRG